MKRNLVCRNYFWKYPIGINRTVGFIFPVSAHGNETTVFDLIFIFSAEMDTVRDLMIGRDKNMKINLSFVPNFSFLSALIND